MPDRPVRVQHRSGALWMLNSAAVELVATVLDDSSDVERDNDGVPTGRLWRYDERLRRALPQGAHDLTVIGREFGALGITSITDATPGLEGFTGLRDLPQRVSFLGQGKLLLRDHDLPSYGSLRELVGERHEAGLPVAVHCVTREALLLTLAVLDDVGRHPADRLEHAAVVPLKVIERLRGLRIVTQPGFIADRGDAYLAEVDADDRPHLYRFGSLVRAGVDVVASSDAPFGPLDPWVVLRAARDRETRTGVVIGRRERVPSLRALSGYLTDPAGRPRTVAPGQPADLCLLRTGLIDAMDVLDRSVVRATWVAGRLVAGDEERAAP